MPEPQEKSQEARPEEVPGDSFGYLRGSYESSIKRAQTTFGKSTFKTLLERREKATTQKEREDINKLISEKRAEKKRAIHEFKKLEDLGYRDSLTGLYNRAGFDKRLEEEVARMKRQGGKSIIGMMDLNKLKEINDKQGHHVGDEYIKKVAEILKEVTRLTDLVARVGGDEFRVVLSNTDVDGALDYWKRLEEKLKEAGVGMSLGFSPLDPHQIDESKNLSDMAMYKAKGERGGSGENHMETAYNLTAEEIQRGPEALKAKYNLR